MRSEATRRTSAGSACWASACYRLKRTHQMPQAIACPSCRRDKLSRNLALQTGTAGRVRRHCCAAGEAEFSFSWNAPCSLASLVFSSARSQYQTTRPLVQPAIQASLQIPLARRSGNAVTDAQRWRSAAAREERSDECDVGCTDLLCVRRESRAGFFPKHPALLCI